MIVIDRFHCTSLRSLGIRATSLRWRHNEHNDVLKHRRPDCLLNRLFMRRSEKTSTFRVTGVVWRIHWWPVNSQHKGPVIREMFPLYDVFMSRHGKIYSRDLVRLLMTYLWLTWKASKQTLDYRCFNARVTSQLSSTTVTWTVSDYRFFGRANEFLHSLCNSKHYLPLGLWKGTVSGLWKNCGFFYLSREP